MSDNSVELELELSIAENGRLEEEIFMQEKRIEELEKINRSLKKVIEFFMNEFS